MFWSVHAPLSIVLGGLVAGYLQGSEGFTAGALSGALVGIPIAIVMFLSYPVAVSPGLSPGAPSGMTAVDLLIGPIVLLIIVVLGAIGDYIGVTVARDLRG